MKLTKYLPNWIFDCNGDITFYSHNPFTGNYYKYMQIYYLIRNRWKERTWCEPNPSVEEIWENHLKHYTKIHWYCLCSDIGYKSTEISKWTKEKMIKKAREHYEKVYGLNKKGEQL